MDLVVKTRHEISPIKTACEARLPVRHQAKPREQDLENMNPDVSGISSGYQVLRNHPKELLLQNAELLTDDG